MPVPTGAGLKNRTGNHKSQRHTDKSENKAVVAVLAIGSLFRGFVQLDR
jgi:hypothetical protein